MTLFMDAPTGFCDKTTFHDEDVVHMCAICKEMFGASFFHPAKSCEVLQKLDSGMIKAGEFSYFHVYVVSHIIMHPVIIYMINLQKKMI